MHHLNKMKDRDAESDPFAKINGTNGLMASADCIFLLDKKRKEDTATFSFTGRKIGSDSWSIRQNPITMEWQKVGTAEEQQAKKERDAYDLDEFVATIRHLLKTCNGLWTGTCTKLLEEVSKFTGHVPAKNINSIGKHLNALTYNLKEYDGIIHVSPDKNGGNNGRPHTFYYINEKQK